MNNNSIGMLIVGVVLGIVTGYYINHYSQASSTMKQINPKHCLLLQALNKLWTEHVVWTRQFIVSSVGSLKDADPAAQRLLKNQEDIGNAIIPFYGKEAGAELTKLLKEHINIAADIVKAALAKNNAQVTELDKKWHQNSSDIALFLSKANPHWNEKAWKTMLDEHLKLTTQELTLRSKGDWTTDITNYDEIFTQALMMAKDLTEGIVKQFPDKF